MQPRKPLRISSTRLAPFTVRLSLIPSTHVKPALLLIPLLEFLHHTSNRSMPIATRFFDMIQSAEQQAQGVSNAVGGSLVRV